MTTRYRALRSVWYIIYVPVYHTDIPAGSLLLYTSQWYCQKQCWYSHDHFAGWSLSSRFILFTPCEYLGFFLHTKITKIAKRWNDSRRQHSNGQIIPDGSYINQNIHCACMSEKSPRVQKSVARCFAELRTRRGLAQVVSIQVHHNKVYHTSWTM